MRIALLHSFYSSRVPSGENQVVLAQADALRAAGHDVLLLGRRTDDLERVPGYALRAGARVATGRGGDPTSRLRAFAPDVVHIHNLFPNIGTAWLKHWDGPVVCTVHNYRPICANGLLFRDGQVCTECPDGDSLAGVRHGCYHHSRLATIPLTLHTRLGPERAPLLARADAVVLLSELSRDVLVRYGLPRDRVRLIPNFVADLGRPVAELPDPDRWVAAGRLSPEKGFVELARQWGGAPLDLAGDGPSADDIRGAGITQLGMLDNESLRMALPRYTGLIFPSLWLESAASQVVVESLEAGIPIVARKGTAAAALVRDSDVGATFVDGRELRMALGAVVDRGAPLRALARSVYEERFHPSVWLRGTESLYREVIAG